MPRTLQRGNNFLLNIKFSLQKTIVYVVNLTLLALTTSTNSLKVTLKILQVYMGQRIQEWTKQKLRKAAFKKFNLYFVPYNVQIKNIL